MPKLKIRTELKNKFKYYDTKIFFDEMKDYGMDLPVEKYMKSWLDEGEIKLLHKPGENKQINEKIMREHLERTKGKVVTRFPPEPNGMLHIGHAKALNLNFEYAKKFGGITYMRFDDTNPKNEADELYDGILEDVKWLGFEPYAITASSDYFDKMLEMSKRLIKKGSAYVDFCSLEEIRNRRSKYQQERDGGNDDPCILSPYRNVSIEENEKEFEKMLKGNIKMESVFYALKCHWNQRIL
ncbi:glutamine--tRNA [Ecytonucleospora hepatopenaei]|uniref:Glutamine--tRNA n=1 Tax=Ecytonucleospora hepatopenaei TaxID=646526 RepID=A0A1W0E7A3_9MICR|nr:glutamine--tRNA [Ecytonucleospora hepatopenaei]